MVKKGGFLPKISVSRHFSVNFVVQEVPAFRDFRIRDPRYFVIWFQALFRENPRYFVILDTNFS